MATITKTFQIDGVLTDMSSVVLCDETGAFGVRRRDTGAVVVPADTAMTRAGTGSYQYSFTDPEETGLVYDYSVKFLLDGETFYIPGVAIGEDSEEPTFAEQMVSKYQGLLLANAGAKSVNVDGNAVSYADLKEDLRYWMRAVRAEKGNKDIKLIRPVTIVESGNGLISF